MCFVWILEQTAISSLYSINWLVFITETECVYCAVRTGSLCTASLTFSNSTFCPHSVFMCFVWIWEQTAIISLYSINWLVCITETECVYCAVRTESLYTGSLTFSNSTFCPHSVFMCFVWIWEQLIGFYNRDGVFTARYELNLWSQCRLIPVLNGLCIYFSFISFDDVLCSSLRGFTYIFISISSIIYSLLNYLYFRVSLCISLGA